MAGSGRLRGRLSGWCRLAGQEARQADGLSPYCCPNSATAQRKGHHQRGELRLAGLMLRREKPQLEKAQRLAIEIRSRLLADQQSIARCHLALMALACSSTFLYSFKSSKIPSGAEMIFGCWPMATTSASTQEMPSSGSNHFSSEY